jgi:hypothetical protein
MTRARPVEVVAFYAESVDGDGRGAQLWHYAIVAEGARTGPLGPFPTVIPGVLDGLDLNHSAKEADIWRAIAETHAMAPHERREFVRIAGGRGMFVWREFVAPQPRRIEPFGGE